MCRYAFHRYKAHFACFGCRKAFKRMLKEDVDPEGRDQPAKCPQCGMLMADMGLDFKAPRSGSVKAWATAASLWTIGITFHSCGCGGEGYRPRDSRSYKKFVAGLLTEYEAALQGWANRKASNEVEAKERQDAIATWRERISRLRRAH